MVGILNRVTSGLILAETMEAYPNGWTFAQSGTATAGVSAGSIAAHSGAKSFDFLPGSSWPSGAYITLTKTVDLKTGANRIVRFFRGKGIPGALYDDFLGSALDPAMWSYDYGGPPVSGSIVTPTDGSLDYNIAAINLQGFRPYASGKIRVSARIQLTATNKQFYWNCFHWPGGDVTKFDFHTDGHIWVSTTGGGAFDCGTYDNAWHIYACEWSTAGGVSWYRDGVLLHTDSTHHSNDSDGYKTEFNCGGGNWGVAYVDWVGVASLTSHNCSLKLGSQTVFDADVWTDANPIDNGFYDECNGWITLTQTGSQTAEIKVRNAGSYTSPGIVHLLFDDLIVMMDKVVTIESLQGGQKVELYNAGGGLMASGTCPAPGTNITLGSYDLSAQIKTAYGFSGYFKVYDTDGVTLLYTTPTITIWGGDLYQWVPNQTNLAIATSAMQIYRTGSGQSPTTATITATLTNAADGTAVSGKTITFTPNLGTCSPTSGTTDGSGKVTTTFTAGSSSGLGGVRANYAGDATYGPSVAQQLIDLYYALIVIDASKDFQAFVEGQEIVIASGNYRLATDFIPQPFTIVSPVLTATVGGWWDVQIYRRGVKEFGGRILTRSRVSGPNPLMTITGVDEKIDLQRRVANKVYLDEPKNIINDLLTTFSCGITAGTISLYGATISLPASYTNLFDALTQIANITGWKFRLNANKTLDYAPTFGIVQAITIQTPGNETTATHTEDWTKLDSKVYVVGSAAAASLVGVASDAPTQLIYGLIEEVFLEKALTDQGTVNLRAQQLLSTRTGVIETIPIDWIDTLATGTYGPFDVVTVIDSDLNLNGGYAIATLQRDLTDANRALLNLSNRVLSIADAIQEVRKNVQDLGVL
jgi:hypothetical protein